MELTFSPTPYRTVHVSVVVPVEDIAKAKRSISSQAGKRGYGKRKSVREHTFGRYATVMAIYPKGN